MIKKIKNKKRIFIFLTLILLFFVFFSSFVWAQTNDRFGGTGLEAISREMTESINQPSNSEDNSLGKAGSWLGNKVLNALLSIIGGIVSFIILPILSCFLQILNFFLKFAIDVNFAITDSNVVIEAWKITRNFANLFFAFGMLLIAIATIVGWEEYQAQRMLPKLLIIALLINFSLVFCSGIVDVGNVFAKYFEKASLGNKEFVLGSLKNMIKPESFLIDKEKQQKQLTEELKKADEEKKRDYSSISAKILAIFGVFLSCFVILILDITVAALIVVFYTRFVVLAFLIILAPLAWVFYFIPVLERELSIWQRWWDSFLKWVIVGPILLFFIWLATFASNEILGSNNKDSIIRQKGQEIEESVENKERIKEVMVLSHQYRNLTPLLCGVLVVSFLLSGLKMSMELGAYGGEYFYGLASGVANKPKVWGGRLGGKLRGWGWQKTKGTGAAVVGRAARGVAKGVPTEPLKQGWIRRGFAKLTFQTGLKRRAIQYSEKEKEEFKEKVKILSSSMSATQLKKLFNLGGGYHKGKFYSKPEVLAALAEKGALLPGHLTKENVKELVKSPLGEGFLSERYFIANPKFEKAEKEGKLSEAMADFVENLSEENVKNIKINNIIENQERLGGIKPEYQKIMDEFYKNLEKTSPKVLSAMFSQISQKNMNKFVNKYKKVLREKSPNDNWFDYLKQVNPSQAKWFQSSPAYQLGIGQEEPKIITAKS